MLFKASLRGEASLKVEAFAVDVPSDTGKFLGSVVKSLTLKWIGTAGPYLGVELELTVPSDFFALATDPEGKHADTGQKLVVSEGESNGRVRLRMRLLALE